MSSLSKITSIDNCSKTISLTFHNIVNNVLPTYKLQEDIVIDLEIMSTILVNSCWMEIIFEMLKPPKKRWSYLKDKYLHN